MSTTFTTEREGQIEFFKNFRIDYENNPVLVDSTDGIWNGNIFEFKLNISDLNKVLFQTIKYLSKMRIKGESIPSNILLVDLNKKRLYNYKSSDYFNDIHKVYIGSASVGVSGFVGKTYKEYDYSKMEDTVEIQKILKSNEFMKITIDENCIVGWAERYYRENPKATKGDFLGDSSGLIAIPGEIRDPKKFKDYILPYTGATNEKFKYLMDQLNDTIHKKDLGAFYTHPIYAKHSANEVLALVNNIIDVGKKDYIILDRCAGTGNLEEALIGLVDKNGDELISHCICSTFEYYEYKVLCERIADKVRTIIPPTESLITYFNGSILNADAESEEYVKNSIVKSYVNNPDCGIVMFENPPYHDESSNGKHTTTKKGVRDTYIKIEMEKDIEKNPYISKKTTSAVQNRFIWSAFKYYLRQPTDGYVLYCPITYWKTQHLIDKKFNCGYIYNRKKFSATSSAISCISWTNIDSKNNNLMLKAYTIDGTNKLVFEKDIDIKKVFNTPAKLFEKKRESEEPIAVMNCSGFNFDGNSKTLLRTNTLNGHGSLTNLYKDNYYNKLPLWVAKYIPIEKWYEKDIYATTTDGGDVYTKDNDFIKSCLIYTCLTNNNHCKSFKDSVEYQNELCFEEGTLAKKKLDTYKITSEEKTLIDMYNKILSEAKKTKKYDSHWKYGIYQIDNELNTYIKKVSGNKSEIIYDYPELNGDLNTLRTLLKDYYIKNITPKMFKYELIK